MLSDPLSINIDGVTYSLARVEIKGTSATYRDPTRAVTLFVGHQNSRSGGIRTTLRLERRKANGDTDDPNDSLTCVVQRTFDRPEYGFSSAEIQGMVVGLQALETTTFVDKLYAGNS